MRFVRWAQASIIWVQRTPLKNFETAFYRSTVADNNSYEQWQVDGSLDTAQRANVLWKKMLNDYQAPAIDRRLMKHCWTLWRVAKARLKIEITKQ